MLLAIILTTLSSMFNNHHTTTYDRHNITLTSFNNNSKQQFINNTNILTDYDQHANLYCSNENSYELCEQPTNGMYNYAAGYYVLHLRMLRFDQDTIIPRPNKYYDEYGCGCIKYRQTSNDVTLIRDMIYPPVNPNFDLLSKYNLSDDDYMIEWYVIKQQNVWHVDGQLIAKQYYIVRYYRNNTLFGLVKIRQNTTFNVYRDESAYDYIFEHDNGFVGWMDNETNIVYKHDGNKIIFVDHDIDLIEVLHDDSQLSSLFTDSNTYSQSSAFTDSDIFTDSDTYIPSSLFTNSNSYSQSSMFTDSDIFTYSDTYSPSSLFTNSNIFTDSIPFVPTSQFTNSDTYSPSSQFTNSDVFTSSMSFVSTSLFTNSIPFTSSNTYSRSFQFTSSDTYSLSSLFTCSDLFTASSHPDLQQTKNKEKRDTIITIAVTLTAGVVIAGAIVYTAIRKRMFCFRSKKAKYSQNLTIYRLEGLMTSPEL